MKVETKRKFMEREAPFIWEQYELFLAKWIRGRRIFDRYFVIGMLLITPICWYGALLANNEFIWIMFGFYLGLVFIVLMAYFSEWKLLKRIKTQ